MAHALSISTAQPSKKTSKIPEVLCVLATLFQALPPVLLLWLSHTAYADPRGLSQGTEDLLTNLLMITSSLTSLSLGCVGIYLILRRSHRSVLSWLFILLGWVGIFAGLVYGQALLGFWVWI
ncbi:MAG: hypothetical protein H6727_11120 [Myxococcales bacterium]|nr:hypothetical protein [Myxococcales bacterium]